MTTKEYGSDFNLVRDSKFLNGNPSLNPFLESDFSLFFSGRAALFNLLQFGIHHHGWENVYIPSYYCHEVVHYIQKLPINIAYYDFNPFLDTAQKDFKWEDINKNVVLNVSFFGMKKLNLSFYSNIIQIEDVTHCILKYKDSSADYCFGSLRKELPVPVGGFITSPKNKRLPTGEYHQKAEFVSIEKITAMNLKSKFLTGEFLQKDFMRSIFSISEDQFEQEYTNSTIPQTAKTILSTLNCIEIIKAKTQNLDFAMSKLHDNPWFTFNCNEKNGDFFGLVIHCNTARIHRELKDFLIINSIYPAVLWPNQLTKRDIETENTILFVHMDFRYSSEDISVITKTINAFKYND